MENKPLIGAPCSQARTVPIVLESFIGFWKVSTGLFADCWRAYLFADWKARYYVPSLSVVYVEISRAVNLQSAMPIWGPVSLVPGAIRMHPEL